MTPRIKQQLPSRINKTKEELTEMMKVIEERYFEYDKKFEGKLIPPEEAFDGLLHVPYEEMDMGTTKCILKDFFLASVFGKDLETWFTYYREDYRW